MLLDMRSSYRGKTARCVLTLGRRHTARKKIGTKAVNLGRSRSNTSCSAPPAQEKVCVCGLPHSERSRECPKDILETISGWLRPVHTGAVYPSSRSCSWQVSRRVDQSLKLGALAAFGC